MLVPLGSVSRAEEAGRELNGHEFLPSGIIASPFAISHFATRTGGGMALGLKTPFVDFDGQSLGELEGDVAFMTLGFSYQQQFGSWFAANADFGGSGRIGIDEQALLAEGVSGLYYFELGGKARLLQTTKTILSLGLAFANSRLVGVDPFGFASRIVEDGLSADNDLVQSGNSFSSRLSVLGGWAPWDWLGMTGYVEGGRGGVNTDDPNNSFGGGVLAGVDFRNLDLIPIGLHVLGKTDGFSESGADLTNRTWHAGFGISFTGWSDFVVGVEAQMAMLERRAQDDDFEAFMLTFNLRYWP